MSAFFQQISMNAPQQVQTIAPQIPHVRTYLGVLCAIAMMDMKSILSTLAQVQFFMLFKAPC